MKVGQKGIELIKRFEGCRLSAYLDSVNVPTIGWGNTFYEDGMKVKMGDSITQDEADQLLYHTVDRFATKVSTLLKMDINQNQFDALVCFSYNVGVANLASSTLLKIVNSNPNQPTIATQFMRWNKAGGKVLKGLTIRRKAESNLYFQNI